MSKLLPRRCRSIQLALLSSLGGMVGAIELAELRPVGAELVCSKGSWVYQSQLDLARADLKFAETERNRMQTLQAGGVISRLDLLDAEERYRFYLRKVNAMLQTGSTLPLPSRSEQLATAEAEVENARFTLDRYRPLFQQGAISKSQYLYTEQAYQQAVKRRDALRQPGAEVRTEPRSSHNCDRPPSTPKINDAPMGQPAFPLK
jgi:multidrug resistance efflux pump